MASRSWLDGAVKVVEVDSAPIHEMAMGRQVADPTQPSLREQPIREDAERAGFVVVKLLGRLTVLDHDHTPRCFRLKRTSQALALRARGEEPIVYRCMQRAGYKTHHPGSGSCTFHGGNSYIRTPYKATSGDYTRGSRYRLAQTILGENDGEPLADWLAMFDVGDELSLQRLLLDKFLNGVFLDEDGQPLPDVGEDVIDRAMGWASDVTKTVERGKRIERADTITRVHLVYLLHVLTKLGKKYVSDERQAEYAGELLHAFGLSADGVRAILEPGRADIGDTIEASM